MTGDRVMEEERRIRSWRGRAKRRRGAKGEKRD